MTFLGAEGCPLPGSNQATWWFHRWLRAHPVPDWIAHKTQSIVLKRHQAEGGCPCRQPRHRVARATVPECADKTRPLGGLRHTYCLELPHGGSRRPEDESRG